MHGVQVSLLKDGVGCGVKFNFPHSWVALEERDCPFSSCCLKNALELIAAEACCVVSQQGRKILKGAGCALKHLLARLL